MGIAKLHVHYLKKENFNFMVKYLTYMKRLEGRILVFWLQSRV